MSASAFQARDLAFRYERAAAPAIDGVDVDVATGEVHGVIGPNGSGKSTLLRLLLGSLRPASGRARYAGRDVAEWPPAQLARRVGVVPQAEELVFPLTVRELAAMGRYPHLGPWRREGPRDRRAVEAALERCDVAPLADRPLSTLSGGERQRARIARALAQEPETLVLDEPTVSLDIRHEMAIFELLRALAAEGTTVLLVTHNLNLAARFADRLLLLDAGRCAAAGPADEVLTRASVEGVYHWPVVLYAHPGPGPDAGAPQVVPLAARPTDAETGD